MGLSLACSSAQLAAQLAAPLVFTPTTAYRHAHFPTPAARHVHLLLAGAKQIHFRGEEHPLFVVVPHHAAAPVPIHGMGKHKPHKEEEREEDLLLPV